MNPLTPFPIMGYAKGFQSNNKPVFLPDQAWSTLENAYTYRERVLERQGNQILGRLQRDLTGQDLGMTVSSQLTYTLDIFTLLSLTDTEPDAELVSSTLVISIATSDTATFTDNGDGTFVVTGKGVAAGSYVNYSTGVAVIVLTSAVGSAAITADFSYYPSLPSMGIWQRDLSFVNETQSIFWDTKYAYTFNGSAFEEFITGMGEVVWTGTDSDFFWAYNYQGPAGSRLLFVTNDNYIDHSTFDPMYYTDGTTWTALTPAITDTGNASTSKTLFQALILIPYYGRLLALNTWEGATDSMTDATNYFNRCRFSQLGDPTAATAWRADIFGLAGSLDAPTGESITGATFVKNTLVVDFEFSTWQLRYVGEYGLPFVWERVSSDFGSGSTFSGVLFDNYRLNVGDVAITKGNSVAVDRIDLDIPDQVFGFQNEQVNQGSQRVWGIRDFQRELVYWCYPNGESTTVDPDSGSAIPITYPNLVLLYNYRNDTWALFRDNVTCFGVFQLVSAVTWDSQEVTWDDQIVTWSDAVDQRGFPAIVKGNQQGFIHLYGYKTKDDPSLSVTEVITTGGLVELTITNHNLFTEEIIYIESLKFIDSTTFEPVATSLNNQIYQVTVVDSNTISLAVWDFNSQSYETDFPYTPVFSDSIYIGGGRVTLFPKMNMISKDINLFQQKGLQTKLSRIDFLLEPQPDNAAITINLILNSSEVYSANILLTPSNLLYNVTDQLNNKGSEYLWYSYYQTLSAQYFRIQITYDDDLMNTLTTHENDCTLYGINSWTRPGGRMANTR